MRFHDIRMKFVAFLAVALLSVLIAAGASAANEIWACTPDTGGANDVSGQADLTRMCTDVNPDNADSFGIKWNWDELYGTGSGNTYDACSLFDSDGDGNINYAVCVQLLSDPNTNLIYNATRQFSCSDKKKDRCTDPTPKDGTIKTYCSAARESSDPFLAGADYPQDTVATCTIPNADVGGPSAVLVNVCSFTSANPNSDPSECIAPTAGNNAFITIRKKAIPNDTSQAFNFSYSGPSNGTATIYGSGASQRFVVTAPGTYSVAETTVPVGWDLTGSSCVNQSNQPLGNDAGTATISNIILQPNVDLICTFENTKRTDWGDLPNGTWFNTSNPDYKWQAQYCTIANQDGARHVVLSPIDNDYKPTYVANQDASIWLGDTVDKELDGAPSDAANGDNIAGDNDESGITFNPQSWQAGVANGGSLTATFSSSSTDGSGSGYLVVWCDWSHDGQFQTSEAAVNTAVSWTGATATQTFYFTIPFCKDPPNNNNCDPGKAPVDDPLFCRARLFAANEFTTSDSAAAAFCGEYRNGEVEDYYLYISPTAVELASFTATGVKKAIVLEWVTVSETNNRGFNLYRATSPDGVQTRINPALIPASPGSIFGATYSYTDTTATRKFRYYYWLEDVDIYGRTTLYGPVSATPK